MMNLRLSVPSLDLVVANRLFLGSWALAASLLLLASLDAFAGPSGVLDVGSRRQVFIDRQFLPQATGVELHAHAARKTGEQTILPDRPWEKGGLGPYSSVLYDGGKYHLWYHAMDSKLWHTSPVAGSICYATSDDGITWRKSNIGLVEYAGNRENNIVVGHGAAGLRIGQDGMMVFIDPNAPPKERLRMVNRFSQTGAGKSDGVNLLSSADGIHWRLTHENIMTYRPEVKGHHLDSQNVMFWDEGLKKYVAFVRRNFLEPERRGRSIARAESDHLGGFPLTQDLPVIFHADPPDPLHAGANAVDYYNSAAIRYPWADNAYYLFPQAYYHYTRTLREFAEEWPANAGPMHTVFAASRDGFKWERYAREPFVRLGMKGEFDPYSVRVIYGLVPDRTGREMYMYYRGSDWLHGWDRDERNRRMLTARGLGADRDITTISRLVLRRDGFVSVRAGESAGEFTTPPLKFAGRRLVLNVDTSATGLVRIACLDGQGKPLPGYSLEEADFVHTTNEINRVVTWQGRSELPQPADGLIRLQVWLRNADVYAFQFTAE